MEGSRLELDEVLENMEALAGSDLRIDETHASAAGRSREGVLVCAAGSYDVAGGAAMTTPTIQPPPQDVEPGRLFIDGEWCDAASGKAFAVQYAPTGEVLTQCAEGDAEDIDRAVAAARRAYEERWSKTSHRLARALQAGTVWVNCYNVFDVPSPFGGYKLSGIGKELGRHALDLYSQTKSVWIKT